MTSKKEITLHISNHNKKSKQIRFDRCTSHKNYENGVCGSVMPVPSLADFEKLFDESDYETEITNLDQPDSSWMVNNTAQSVNNVLNIDAENVAEQNAMNIDIDKNQSLAIPQKESAKRTSSCISNISINCESTSSDNIDGRPIKKGKIQRVCNNKSDCEVSEMHRSNILTSVMVSPVASTSQDNGTFLQQVENMQEVVNTQLFKSTDHLKNKHVASTKHIKNIVIVSPVPGTSRYNETTFLNGHLQQIENTQVGKTQPFKNTEHVKNTHDANTQSLENADIRITEPIEVITIDNDNNTATMQNKDKRTVMPHPTAVDQEHHEIITNAIRAMKANYKDVFNNFSLHSSDLLNKLVKNITNHIKHCPKHSNIINVENQNISMGRYKVTKCSLNNQPVPKSTAGNKCRNINDTNNNKAHDDTCNDLAQNRCQYCNAKYILKHLFSTANKGHITFSTYDDSSTKTPPLSKGSVASDNARYGQRPTNNVTTTKSTDIKEQKIIFHYNTRGLKTGKKPTNSGTGDPRVAGDDLETVTRNFGNCPICLEPLNPSTTASTLCGHIFCINCIKSILKNSKRCPICRKYFRKNGYHPLFLN